MKKTVRIFSLAALLLLLCSCEFVMSLIHDDDVVARLGNRKLYRSTLETVVPRGLPPEDSTNLALQYIHTWATELLYSDIAAQQLSKQEQDVTSELEEYRQALLKFRYEQRYINERLDTTVTPEQTEQYYEAHHDLFILQVPIVKARFLDIMKESPNLEILKKYMSSADYEEVALADSIAYSSALRYEDHSDSWMEMTTLARYFGTDYGTLLSGLGASRFIETDDDRGDLRIAYICDIIHTGALAPLEFCEPRIRDIIISNRKRSLLSALEQDLLEDALDKDNLIIY